MFAILVLCLALRPFLSAPYLVTILNITNWTLIVRGEYLILFTMIASGAWFAYLIYPTRWYRRVAFTVDFIFLVGVILVVILPVYLFSYSVWAIQVIALSVLLYAIFMSLKGSVKGRWLDVLYLIAFLSIGAAWCDILLANAMEENQRLYILSFMMLVFVMIQPPC